MKKSIKYQLTFILTALIIGTFILCFFANTFFLEKYYVLQKQKLIKNNYYTVKNLIDTTEDTSNLLPEFESIYSNYGIAIIVIDPDGSIIASSTTNVSALRRQFLDAVVSNEAKKNIIENNDDFVLQSIYDDSLENESLMLLGTTSKGDFVMLRVTVESIKESVKLSNTFMTYIIIIAMIISIIIVIYISSKITNPILELAAISVKMSNLEFDVKYTSKSNNEIDVLGNNMNQLSSNLENTISQLRIANIQLQKDIDEKNQIDEMRKEFLANISHELKTPIALVQGYAEGLKECVNDDIESRNMYCDVIIDEANRMNRLVKQLLTLNQLESGDADLYMERFDIVELIKGKMSSFEIISKQKDINFYYKGDDKLYVWSDAYKIEDVLSNYISNAFNHVCNENEIYIELVKNEEKTKISVYNSGNNIPEEELEKIWDKLYKVDKARTREYGGNGIGLSIVKANMDNLNNKYGVENCDNGVKFWFEVDNG